MSDTSSPRIFPRFEGRTVLVTGAGTGFGHAIAVRAAQEGADVVVHYNRSKGGAEATADEVRALGRTAHIVQADIGSWDAITALADEVFGLVGTLDVLINNVGDFASETQGWRDLTAESLDRVIDVDVKGTLVMTHVFGGRMVDQGHGAIVNIGSTVVVRGSARAPHYAAAKYAILGVTKSYAQAFAPTVRVNTFAPGFMETEALKARADWKAGRREKLIAATPMGTIPEPEVVAGTALWLATEEAGHLTGGYLVADGGYNMVGA